MNIFKLITLWSCTGVLATATTAGALAQAYPVKSVRIIVGFSAGGGGDVSGRILAQKMSASLGQPVIVDIRAGAGGAIASELVAKSPADGHTLLYAAGAFAALPALRANLPFDTERDFAPISLAVITAFVMSVHPSVPVRDVKSLIALARSRPGVLTFSSPGVGSSAHLAGELFNMMAQVKLLHVPFKGSPEAATAVAAGEIDVGMPSVSAVTPLLAIGKLRAIAVTGAKRSALFPAVPTLDESGLRGYQRGGWNGMFAPAGVPRDVIVQLNSLIGKIVNSPEMTEMLKKLGFEPRTGTPEQFAAFVKNEMAQNAKLVKFAGLTPN
jgi:tripartite-type tricarboxylate transporter receptor subunit TctC